MPTKRVSRRLSPIQEYTRKRSSPRRGSVKRKRDSSKEREASNERRKRLSSQDAFQALLNKWSNSNKANKNKNIKLLKNELNKNKNKNKNKTMNLLSNKGNVKRKFTFKGLGNPLGIKI